MVLIPVFSAGLPFFFNYIEKRDGVLLNDWLLAHIPAHNVSVLIFTFIWGMMLLLFARSLYKPSILITYCFTLAFVTIARISCIYLVPLTPPVGLIPLTDPLTGVFYGEASITKDLFFSGHISTMMMVYFCLEKKSDKTIALLSTIAVAVLLLVQHIHYTIDVVTAPIVVYAFYTLTIHLMAVRQVKRQKVVKERAILSKAYQVNN
jgi:hypothetical protein